MAQQSCQNPPNCSWRLDGHCPAFHILRDFLLKWKTGRQEDRKQLGFHEYWEGTAVPVGSSCQTHLHKTCPVLPPTPQCRHSLSAQCEGWGWGLGETSSCLPIRQSGLPVAAVTHEVTHLNDRRFQKRIQKAENVELVASGTKDNITQGPPTWRTCTGHVFAVSTPVRMQAPRPTTPQKHRIWGDYNIQWKCWIAKNFMD